MKDNFEFKCGAWKKDLRIYVHVPFCVKKCDYCDFISGPSGEEDIKNYFDALFKEIRSYKDRGNNYIISSVFIGGGTPSSVDSKIILKLLDELRSVFEFDPEAEMTIEVNPGTLVFGPSGVDREKLMDYKRAEINRLSFGLQSTNDNELMLLGRIHTYGQFEANYRLARELGFNNINIDLMSSLPGQDINTWEATLLKVASLKPEHISAYSLIIEEGTPFYERYGPKGTDRDKLPSEDMDRLMYSRTKEILLSYGYERYEISNYAYKGYECRHNLAYWEGTSYLGLGLSSASLIESCRFRNTSNLQDYIKSIQKNDYLNKRSGKDEASLLEDYFDIKRDVVTLSKNEQIEEFMFLGLRKSHGISKSEFLNRFKIDIDLVYKDLLNKLEKENLISINKDRILLTDYGIDVSNLVLADFLFD